MKIIIKKGEPLWSEDGYHILDKNGFAVLNEELHKEITIKDPDAVERIKKSLPRERWDEIYQLAIDSTAIFLADKELELVEFEQEKQQIFEEQIQLEQKKLEEQIVLEKEQFEAEGREIEKRIKQEQEQAELEFLKKQKEETEAQEALRAKSEAEMAEAKQKSQALIAERKLREAEEAAAAEAEKKAQQELIASLLERIQKLEEGK